MIGSQALADVIGESRMISLDNESEYTTIFQYIFNIVCTALPWATIYPAFHLFFFCIFLGGPLIPILKQIENKMGFFLQELNF